MKEYFEALSRLKSGRPAIVAKGIKITKDAVSVEAGRQKGSIKKSRPRFTELIAAIDAAAKEQASPQQEQERRITKVKLNIEDLQAQLDAALAREQSLVLELYDLRKDIAKLTGATLYPIRRR